MEKTIIEDSDIYSETFILTSRKTIFEAIVNSQYEYNPEYEFVMFDPTYNKIDRRFLRNITREYKENLRKSIAKKLISVDKK